MNLIHCTATGGNADGVGSRIPAVWIYPNKNDIQWYHWTSATGNLVGGIQFSLNTWHSFEIVHRRYHNNIYQILITLDGNIVYDNHQITYLNPEVFKKVKCYASDPWYPALKGSIKSLNYSQSIGM